MVNTSNRLKGVPASAIRKLVPLATAAKQAGVMVYHLNIGDPDIKTPEVMLQALKDWDRNPIGYANSQGEADLLAALSGYYRGLGYGFVDQPMIQVTQGGSEALLMALLATCEAGDEVLVFEPFFTAYASVAAVAGVRLVPVTTTIENGFHLPESTLIAQKLTEHTRAILFTNPNNPTGTVFTKDEVDRLVALARERGLFLIGDEVYREYAFDGRQSVSLLSYMQEMPEHIIVLDSLSKRYSVCGLRIGCLVSLNQEVMAGCLRIAMGRLCVGLVDQAVAARLSQVPSDYITGVRDEYQKRRNAIYEGLHEIPGVTIQKPEGAFYCVVGLPVQDAEAYCAWLLTDFRDNGETVMLSPMGGFYSTAGMGKNQVRIAYVLEVPKLQRAVALVKQSLLEYTMHR